MSSQKTGLAALINLEPAVPENPPVQTLSPVPSASVPADKPDAVSVEEGRAGKRPRRSPKKQAKQDSVATAASTAVGTIETPYLRQSDGKATRKVGVVLPVELIEEIEVHCARTRQRKNRFIEETLREALGLADA